MALLATTVSGGDLTNIIDVNLGDATLFTDAALFRNVSPTDTALGIGGSYTIQAGINNGTSTALLSATTPAAVDDVVNFDGLVEQVKDGLFGGAGGANMRRDAFEFETAGPSPGTLTQGFRLFSGAGTQLYPAGLTIGGLPANFPVTFVGTGSIANPVDELPPVQVVGANLFLFNDNGDGTIASGEIISAINVLSLFTATPWNGTSGIRITPGASPLVGIGINGFQLQLDVLPLSPVLTTNPASGGTVSAGNVRVGTSQAVGVSATNTGAAGTTLTGSFGTATGDFSGGGTPFSLAQSASANESYVYAPSARGADSEPITVTSNGGTSTVNLAGTGVGPVYADDAEGGCVDVGDILFGQTSTNFFSISNTTSDGDLGGLTDLTITAVTIVDLDGNAIWSTDLAPGTVLAAGESVAVNIFADYAGNPNVPANAQLIIETDEGAALGGDGNNYTVDLCGYAVPEPSSIVLGALGLVGVAYAGLRRRRSA